MKGHDTRVDFRRASRKAYPADLNGIGGLCVGREHMSELITMSGAGWSQRRHRMPGAVFQAFVKCLIKSRQSVNLFNGGLWRPLTCSSVALGRLDTMRWKDQEEDRSGGCQRAYARLSSSMLLIRRHQLRSLCSAWLSSSRNLLSSPSIFLLPSGKSLESNGNFYCRVWYLTSAVKKFGEGIRFREFRGKFAQTKIFGAI